MSYIKSLFATRLYHAALSDLGQAVDPSELENSCLAIAEDDEAGQAWCEENNFPGYTSYASLTDLDWRFPIFKDVIQSLDKHIAAFAQDLNLIWVTRKSRSIAYGSTYCPLAAFIRLISTHTQ